MPCWRSFDQSLARIRQGRPDVSEELAWRELHVEITFALCGMSEGIPIAKFRYPLRGGLFDLVVLFRNNHLTLDDIQWQNVECNQEWLDRRWPLLAREAGVGPEKSQPPTTLDLVDAPTPTTQADVGTGADAKSTPTADAAPKPIGPAVTESAAQEMPARQELVWPSAEQLGIVKAPKQTAILRKWPELCRRYPNMYNADKVRAREVSGRRLAGHVGDVDPKSARAFLRALCAWLEQHS
jgi:hypothetical protein